MLALGKNVRVSLAHGKQVIYILQREERSAQEERRVACVTALK